MDTTLSRMVLSDRLGYRLARHTLFWVACLLFFGAIYGSFWRWDEQAPLFNAHSFVEAAFYLPLHMFLSYAIIYLLLPQFLFTGKYVHLVLGVLFFMLVTAVFSYFISRYLVNPYRDWLGLPLSTKLFPNGLMSGLRGSNTVAGFAVAIKLVKHGYFKKMETEELEKAKLKAELQLLQGQLHPHFLFNTLNNLYALVLQRSTHAAEVVVKLSALLQYMLTESRQAQIPVEKEIDMLRHYIDLEKIRFGERLDLQVHIEGRPGQTKIAPLILLPFVENAFKHGASEMLDPPWISLAITHRDDGLDMKLINGKTHQGNGTRSTGIGLSNVQRRLNMLYPGRHELRTLDQEESYLVNLHLQLKSA